MAKTRNTSSRLYRITYVRDAKPRSITFAAKTTDAALDFYHWWEKKTQKWSPDTVLLTLKPVAKR